MRVNEQYGCPHVENVIVVTHGLTIRLLLMQIFDWSPNTFETVWNAGNCDIYVLEKDLSKAGPVPFTLNETVGNSPKSSINVTIRRTGTAEQTLCLQDYLSLPSPRSLQVDLIKSMIEKQFGIDP